MPEIPSDIHISSYVQFVKGFNKSFKKLYITIIAVIKKQMQAGKISIDPGPVDMNRLIFRNKLMYVLTPDTNLDTNAGEATNVAKNIIMKEKAEKRKKLIPLLLIFIRYPASL